MVIETDLVLSDISTNNADASKHGLMPKLPNDATKFLDGLGAWSLADISTNPLVVDGDIEMQPSSRLIVGDGSYALAVSEIDMGWTGFGLLYSGFFTQNDGFLDSSYIQSLAGEVLIAAQKSIGSVSGAAFPLVNIGAVDEIAAKFASIDILGSDGSVWIRCEKFGVFGVVPTASQQALIADPVDLATALTAIAELNALLKAYGLEAVA